MSYPYQIKSIEEYKQAYQKSVDDPEGFWSEIAKHFLWQKKWDRVLEWNFSEPKIKWFAGGKLNITENCLDRHLKTKAGDPAIIWEPNNPAEATRILTYNDLHTQVCMFGQVLKNNGVKKGDRVCIYMGMIPELAIAMLACARIGAIHSVIFGGFSAQSIADRVTDAHAEFIITCDGAYRGPKEIPLKAIIDDALTGCAFVKRVIVYKRTNSPVNIIKHRDVWWEEEMQKQPPQSPKGEISKTQPLPNQDAAHPSLPEGKETHSQTQLKQEIAINKESSQSRASVVDTPPLGGRGAEPMDAEDMLFILYTSGSTGKPKGVVHTCGGYMVYTTYSFVNVFQYQPGQIHFCTADIGWITGHSYILYGPLCAGATSLMFEGIPTWPDAGRFWQIIEKHKVNILYTAPTAIRSLMGFGTTPVENKDLSSLQVLGTVGEPINEEAWHWYDEHIGKKKSPIVDTWWQTETGGILISNLAGITPSKPTFATLPLPGVQLVLVAPSDSPGGGESETQTQPPQSPKGELSNAQPLRGQDANNSSGFSQSRDSATDNPPLGGRGAVPQGAGEAGNLCIKFPWPAMLRTTYNDHERCRLTYFSTYPGLYFTGDGAIRDPEGNYRITGRVDDVLNVSGHRIGTAEVENAIGMHTDIIESAVVGFPHQIKGQGIYAYVVLDASRAFDALDHEVKRKEIMQTVTGAIGAIARPDKIQFVSGLPKTRSGKIMRRILRKIAEGETENFGDTSTLVDPAIVDEMVKGRL